MSITKLTNSFNLKTPGNRLRIEIVVFIFPPMMPDPVCVPYDDENSFNLRTPGRWGLHRLRIEKRRQAIHPRNASTPLCPECVSGLRVKIGVRSKNAQTLLSPETED